MIFLGRIYYINKKGCDEVKQLGFVGVDSTDMVLYLARLLSCNEKKVAVIDYTKRHQLIQTANVPDVLFGTGSYYKEILIVAAEALTDEREVKSCEYIFHYFGAAVSHPQIANCTELFFVTDMIPTNASLLKEVKCSEVTKKYCIIRNMIDAKYRGKYLVSLMEQGFAPKDAIELPYAEQDYRCRCYLCIDTKHKLKIKELSAGMQQVLLYLFKELEQADEKTIKKIVKKA